MYDIFAAFKSDSDADAYCRFLITRHENIKFNFEKGNDNKPLILDKLIILKIFVKKKTYPGLLLNYFNFVFNLGLIKTFGPNV